MTTRRWKIRTPAWVHEVTTRAPRRKVAVDELDDVVAEAPVELRKFVGKAFRKLLTWAEKISNYQVDREEIRPCSAYDCIFDSDDTCDGCRAPLCEVHAGFGQYEARTLCDECLQEAIQDEVEGEVEEL